MSTPNHKQLAMPTTEIALRLVEIVNETKDNPNANRRALLDESQQLKAVLAERARDILVNAELGGHRY